MKRTLMELGGKGAAVVLPDADPSVLRLAVSAVGSTWAFHSGQICTAPTRVLVHRDQYEHVITALESYARSLKIGSPVDNSTVVGPLISSAQRDRVEAYIAGARGQGARVVTGGAPPDLEPGISAAPPVSADVAPGMTVAREEIFGPVGVAIPYRTEDEAV